MGKSRKPLRTTTSIFAVLTCFIAIGCARSAGTAGKDLPPVKTVDKVDLSRYIGVWYELAHYPFWAQKNCHCTTATYGLRPDGRISVLNQCRKGGCDGKLKTAHAVAWVVDKETNAKLKVRFFWPFTGDYWIIDLGKNYEYAVVSNPNRSYLWILSRTPEMASKVYEGILKRITEQGFDPAKLVISQQLTAAGK
jgi:apolipoprotein D and lipocalin family protein